MIGMTILRAVVLCMVLGGVCWAEDFQEFRNSDGSCLEASPKGISLRHCEGLPSQHWKLVPAGDYVKMSTEGSPDLCLDIINDGTNNQLQLAKCSNVSGQSWKATKSTRSTKLTSLWRGEDQCLAVADYKALVAPCSNGNHNWQTYVVQGGADAEVAEGSFDGEVPGTYSTEYELVLQFGRDCKLAIPGEPEQGTPLFRCRRRNSDMICIARNAADLGEVYSTRPGLKVLRAPIAQDGKSLVFATPRKAFQFTADPKAGTATLVQPGAQKCKGQYIAHDKFAAAAKTYGAAHPVYIPGPPSSSSDHSSTTTSTPAKPKGSERGRMCGGPTDCQSGVCAMENKTRGRCQ